MVATNLALPVIGLVGTFWAGAWAQRIGGGLRPETLLNKKSGIAGTLTQRLSQIECDIELFVDKCHTTMVTN